MAKKKKKSLPSSLIVTQSNSLVEARYNLPLSEQRLILTMISKIQPDDADFKPYRISINEFAEFLGIDKNHVYVECKKITNNLLSRVLSIEETGRFVQTHWMSSAEYIDGSGIVNLSFDPLLKPYLLQLKSNFTSCKLNMILSFKSQYTMRIYSLLKQYERLKEREIELTELREMLGIGKEQYKLYTNFKKDILEYTRKELAEKADLYFEFDEIKYGRRVGAIHFHIFTRKLPNELTNSEQKPQQSIVPEASPAITPAAKTTSIDALLSLIPQQYQAHKALFSVINESQRRHGSDYVKRNILYSNSKADQSYIGFLCNALMHDWAKDWQEEQKKPEPVRPRVPEIWERYGFKTKEEYNIHTYNERMTKLAKMGYNVKTI